MSELGRVRKALAPVEHRARGLRWAAQRPWRAETHVQEDRGVVVVDLHDLDAATTRDAVDALLDPLPAAGAIVFVHGVGRHSAGGPVLVHVVRERLPKGSTRPLGNARTVWIADPAVAPAWTRGDLGWGFRFLFLVLAVLFVAGLAAALTGR